MVVVADGIEDRLLERVRKEPEVQFSLMTGNGIKVSKNPRFNTV